MPGVIILLAVVVTNQSAVGRGLLTEEGLNKIHGRLGTSFAGRGARLDAVYFCPHYAQSADPRYGKECDCRKPNPGLALRAAAELGIDLRRSYMIGDKVEDVLFGRKIGAEPVLVLTGSGRESLAKLRELGIEPAFVAESISRPFAGFSKAKEKRFPGNRLFPGIEKMIRFDDILDKVHRFNMTVRFEIFEPINTAEAGVVKQDVNLSIQAEYGLNHHFDLSRFIQVHRGGKRLTTFTLDLSRKGLQPVEPARGKHNFASLAHKETRGISPNPDDAPVMRTTLFADQLPFSKIPVGFDTSRKERARRIETNK